MSAGGARVVRVMLEAPGVLEAGELDALALITAALEVDGDPGTANLLLSTVHDLMAEGRPAERVVAALVGLTSIGANALRQLGRFMGEEPGEIVRDLSLRTQRERDGG